MNLYYYDTTLGRIAIAANGTAITNLYFHGEHIPENMEIRETALLGLAADQLEEYLAGRLKVFSLPLEPAGSDFMQRVWQALRAIPYGKTASYQEIAVATGNPKAARAVGMANNRNPLPIFIPCHRVIGVKGTLVGYAGGLHIKVKLLEIEGVIR